MAVASSFRLQQRKAVEWKDQVDILFGDMRTLALPEPADILVSELLGSFGDNELSPECLDGATRFLKRKSHVRFSFASTAQFHGVDSKRHFDPLLVLCIPCPVVFVQTLQRGSRGKRRQGSGDAVRSDVSGGERSQRSGGRRWGPLWLTNTGMLGV